MTLLCLVVLALSSDSVPDGDGHRHHGFRVPSHAADGLGGLVHWQDHSHVQGRRRSAESHRFCTKRGKPGLIFSLKTQVKCRRLLYNFVNM